MLPSFGASRNRCGFFGRERGSDLYYTAFALRGLAMLDGLDRPNDLQRVADYLIQQAGRVLSIVDVVSWLYSLAMVQAAGAGLSVPIDFTDDRVADQLSQLLESYRTDDGGYVKSAGGALGSVYHSFLVVLIYEFLVAKCPHPIGWCSSFSIGSEKMVALSKLPR